MIVPFRILVIDDDKEMRESLAHLLETAGFDVQCISKAENVLSRLESQNTDALLCDVRMPGVTGIELLEQLKDITTVPMVLMSAHGDIDMAVSAIQQGAYSFLEKPFDPRRLFKLLENASRLHRLSRNAERLQDRLADLAGLDRILIGKTKSIEALRADIMNLSSAEANVMLLGETGTGKELVARALHDLGPRAAEPFIALNCAAIPVSSFEETLFGMADKSAGLLGKAEGGTLFIDELGAIPGETQAKLLRVIETKQYSAVNSSDLKQANVRIVSAANERLDKKIKSGEFREDLYFRLNTIVLNMPPLRERADDIVMLYMHYLAIFSATYEVDEPKLTSDDLAMLIAYNWPGNVRELRSVCERHVLAVRRGAGSVKSALRSDRDEHDTPETLREAVAAFERQLIAKALVTHEGRMDDVANALGIGRRTLNEKIVKLGLDKKSLLNDQGLDSSPCG